MASQILQNIHKGKVGASSVDFFLRALEVDKKAFPSTLGKLCTPKEMNFCLSTWSSITPFNVHVNGCREVFLKYVVINLPCSDDLWSVDGIMGMQVSVPY